MLLGCHNVSYTQKAKPELTIFCKIFYHDAKLNEWISESVSENHVICKTVFCRNYGIDFWFQANQEGGVWQVEGKKGFGQFSWMELG